jgi:integrase
MCPAERMGYSVKNPVVGVQMYRQPLDSMRVVSYDEQASYLAEASQPLSDIAEIMLDTGMRPEEVFRIMAENIDFKQMTIFNPFGKTKAARRAIPMTENVSSRLKRRLKESERLTTPFVFPSPHNTQTPIGSVKKAHRAAIDRAEIKPRFRLYDLRHTFATRVTWATSLTPYSRERSVARFRLGSNSSGCRLHIALAGNTSPT